MTTTAQLAGAPGTLDLDRLTRYRPNGIGSMNVEPIEGQGYYLVKDVHDALARRAPDQATPAQIDSNTFAVNFIRQRAEQYLQDHADTEPGTGALAFEFGEAGREYHSTLVELADDIDAALEQAEGAGVCAVPPAGWACTRAAGHEGPCAAVPATPAAQIGQADERALPCPFCGGKCDPEGWFGDAVTRGPECETCGATANSMEWWNRRSSTQPAATSLPSAPTVAPTNYEREFAEATAEVFGYTKQDVAALVAWERYRLTASTVPGMPALASRPCFVGGWQLGYRAALATQPAASSGIGAQAEPIDQGHALRAVRRLIDGSQPKDLPGAIAAIDHALSAGIMWSYDITPPQAFVSYVKANYTGDVHFHDPEWHAVRLWNAAMKAVGPRVAADAPQQAADAKDVGIEALAPVISSYDIEKVKRLKFQFVESLIHNGIQYRTCGGISAVLNQIIDDSEAAAKADRAAMGAPADGETK
jgi:hypothetical protein